MKRSIQDQPFKVLKRLTVMLFAILLSSMAYAQKNYIPASVITLEGDTLKGYIDYRNWASNPHQVSFTKKLGGQRKKFTVHDIQAFIVADEKYISAEVDVDVSSLKIEEIKVRDFGFNFIREHVFLQTLVQGEKNLYYYQTNQGRENFYFFQDTSFVLLKYKKVKVKEGYVTDNNEFRNQLLQYFEDAPFMQARINRASYHKESLEKVYEHYYKETTQDESFQKDVEKVKLEFGLLLGASFSKIAFKSDVPSYQFMEDTQFPMSTNMTMGLAFDLVFPRSLRRWSFNNELVYSAYESKGYLDEEIYATTTTIGAQYIKLNSMMRYKYPINNHWIYTNMGVSNGFSMNITNDKLRKYALQTDTPNSGEAVLDTSDYELGFVFGVGGIFHKIGVEGRYEYSSGISNGTSLSSPVNRYSLLLRYIFK